MDMQEFEPADVEELVAAAPVSPWMRFRPLIAEAMDQSFYSIDALEAKLRAGEVLFFPGKNAAVVAEIVNYEGGQRAMQTLWAAGDVDEIAALAPGIEAVARMAGCTSMIVEGRAAWKKILGPMGYEPWSVTLRKVL